MEDYGPSLVLSHNPPLAISPPVGSAGGEMEIEKLSAASPTIV
jgi:hypothetical protein